MTSPYVQPSLIVDRRDDHLQELNRTRKSIRDNTIVI